MQKERLHIDNSNNTRQNRSFYTRDVLDLAPDLIGRVLIISDGLGSRSNFIITETEAYRGEEDKACHASRGRTKRTEIMYHTGGMIYMYFVYGMYWMLNIVASEEGNPQAVLIRSVEGISGPGRLTKIAKIDGSFYGEDLTTSQRIWISEEKIRLSITISERVGISYAGSPWREKPWRFIAL